MNPINALNASPAPRCVFICGHAGTGKTTLAHQVLQDCLQNPPVQPWCVLDKDTLYGRYSAAVMQTLTGDPHDRDSPIYLEHLREPEYQSLLDVAREQLALGISVIIVAPFSREVRDGRLFDRDWLDLPPASRIDWVWVQVPESVARARITSRNNPRDRYKLAHWDDYRTRLFEPEASRHPALLILNNDIGSTPEAAATALNTGTRRIREHLATPPHSLA